MSTGSLELLLEGREVNTSAPRPTVTWHVRPGWDDNLTDRLFTPIQESWEGRSGKSWTPVDFEGYRREFAKAEEAAKQKMHAPLMYEQVVHFPSFQSAVVWVREEALAMQALYKASGAHGPYPELPMLANDRINYQNSGQGINLDFNRVKGLDGLLNTMEYGWPGGRERLAQETLEFERNYKHEVASPTWLKELVGDEVDIAGFLTGDPEHMYGYHAAQKSRKAVSVTVDTSVRCDACGVRSHDAAPTPPLLLLMRGLMAMMLVQQLARAGHAVTLRTVTHSHYHQASIPRSDDKLPNFYSPRGEMRDRLGQITGVTPREDEYGVMRTLVVDIVKPGERVDLDNAMLALAHEGWARQFDFAVQEVYGLQYPFTPVRGFDKDALAEVVKRLTFYNRNYWVVGELPLNESWRLPLVTAVDTRSDIYIPSQPLARDITNGLLSFTGDHPSTKAWRVETAKRLFGENFAYHPTTGNANEAMTSVAAMAEEVHGMLQAAGVNFV